MVDLLALVYRLYPEATIEAHVVLPESQPSSGYDAGYYHANGYAALQELEAWALENPFNGHQLWLHLYGEENTEGELIGMSDLHRMIADFNYLSVTSDFIHHWFGRLAESTFQYPLYYSTGLYRFIFPTDLILKYLSLSLWEGLLRKLTYNCFRTGEGYVNEERPLDYKLYFNDYRFRLMDLNHLSLNCIDKECDHYFEDYWHAYSQRLTYEKARAEAEKHNMNSSLDVVYQDFKAGFLTGFRNEGVASYFNQKRSEIKERTSLLLANFDSSLDRDMSLSVYDRFRLTDAILHIMNERKNMWLECDIPSLNVRVTDAMEEARKIEEEVQAFSLLRRIFFEKARFYCYQDTLSNLYLHKTQLIANGYAMEVSDALCAQLANHITTLLDQLSKVLQAQIEVERLKDEVRYELTSNHALVKYLHQMGAIGYWERILLHNQEIMDDLFMKCKDFLLSKGLSMIEGLSDVEFGKKQLFPTIAEYAKSLDGYRELIGPIIPSMFDEIVEDQRFVSDAMRKSSARIALSDEAVGMADPTVRIWNSDHLYLSFFLDSWEKRDDLIQAFMQSHHPWCFVDDRVDRIADYDVDVLQLCGGFTLQMLKVYPLLRDAYERVKNTYDNKQ